MKETVVAIAALMTLCLAALGVFMEAKAAFPSSPAAPPADTAAFHVADASGSTIVSSSSAPSVPLSIALTRAAQNTAATDLAAATATEIGAASNIFACDEPGGMGLSRIIEIDTTGGPGFGLRTLQAVRLPT